jgi:hypothetical protein
MTFEIPDQEYTYENFINQILQIELEPYHNFKVSCFLTEFNNWIEGYPSLTEILNRNNFIIQDLGDIKRGLIDYYDKDQLLMIKIIFYFYLDAKNKILYSFSDTKTDIIKNIFGKLVNYERNIYSLYVGASSFYNVMRRIKEIDESAECIYFTAKHKPTYATKGKIRSDKRRTFIYYAPDGDGNETLIELRDQYGALPSIMRFRIMDLVTFEIQNIGLFTVMNEYDSETARLKLLEIIEIIVEYVLVQKQILVDSKYTLIPIKTRYKTFNVPNIKPWSIIFREKLEDDIIDNIVDILTSEDFSIYNSFSETGGSFILNGLVADGRKDSLFSVHIKNDEMVIAPIEKCSFDTFMRFYEVIVENIDPQADIAEVT